MAGYTYQLRLKDMMSSGFAKAAQSSTKFYNKLIGNQNKYLNQSKRVPANISLIGKRLSTLKTKVDSAFSTLKVKRFNNEARKSRNILKTVGIGIATYIGFSSAISLATNSIQKFDVQAKADAQMKSVLISTNNAAGRSYEQLKQQATSLQGKTLFGDEETQSIQSLLLTFKNVRTEMFDKSIPAIQDMATAMKVDGKSAAIQLGKALNDPATGLTMLGRSGITFTESQKKQIKGFQSTNQLAKAQAIILQEVNSQFKGSAEAAAKSGEGAWQQFTNRVGDNMEVFGGWLSRLKGKVAIFFNSFLDQIQPLISAWNSLISAFTPLFQAIGSFIGEMELMNTETDAAGQTVGFLSTAINIASNIIEVASYGVSTLLQLLEPLAPAIKWITIAVGTWKTAQWLLNIALNSNPIGVIIGFITGLVGAIVWVSKHTEGWAKSFRAVTTMLKVSGKMMWSNMKYSFGLIWSDLKILGLRFKQFGQYIKGLFNNIGKSINLALSFDFEGAKKALTAPIVTGAEGEINAIKEREKQTTKQYYKEKAENLAQLVIAKNQIGIKYANKKKDLEKIVKTNTIKNNTLSSNSLGKDTATTSNALNSIKSTSNAIATGGKKQFTLNVQIDKVLETVNQTITNGEQSANELVDEILDNLTRRLHGSFQSVGQ